MKKALQNDYLLSESASNKATNHYELGVVPSPRALPVWSLNTPSQNQYILLELLAVRESNHSATQEFVNKYGLLDLVRWYYAIDKDGSLRFRRGAFQALGLPDTPSVLRVEKPGLPNQSGAEKPLEISGTINYRPPDRPDAEEFLETYFPYKLPRKRRQTVGDRGIVHDLIAAHQILADREPLSLFVWEVRRLRSLVGLYNAIQRRKRSLLVNALVRAQVLTCSHPTQTTGWREEIEHLEFDALLDYSKSHLAFSLNFFLKDIPIIHNEDLTRSRDLSVAASFLEELYAVFSDLVAEDKGIRRCASLPCRVHFLPRVSKQIYCDETCSTRERVRRHRQKKPKPALKTRRKVK